ESFLRAGLVTKEQVQGTVQHPNKAQELSRTLGLKIGTDNREAARAASVIIVCVKPQTVAKVLEEMAPELNGSKLVLSIAAS
ncbi:prephenate dehydrogenase/arogenate dehydrogenase family protein, partial [Escherichia coli]|uniref:pyrroline-5-carboxylate reductase family protein n=1 Tax=Escherichia coli TaxID=562 RepID=UPI0028DDD3E6